MKIKTQFIGSMVIFGVMLLIIAASVIATNQQVEQLSKQEEIAKQIERDASELGYLSNDYLLYHESPQRARWESKFSDLSYDMSNLNPNTPEQQALVNNMRANQQRLKAVFTDVVSTFENTSQDQALFQISWSRMAVQNQGMAFDAERLAQTLRDQVNQLKQTNITLIFVLLGVFGAYFLTNYFLIFRRMLKSVSELQAGTRIIGSGNFDFSIKQKKDDEIGELSQAFNQMTVNLKDVTASKTELEREITERKRAEEALRKAHDELELRVQERTAELAQASEGVKAERQRFNDILNMLPAYLVLLSPDYHVPFANRFFRERFGESHGKRCFEYLFGRSESCEICETYTVLKTIAPHHWEWTGPDGRNYDVFDVPFTDTDGSTLIMEVGIDITERKQAEEKIREQAALLDKAQDAIGVRDLEHRLIYWNKGAQRLYGWTAEEAMGRNADGLLYRKESPSLVEAKSSVIKKGEWTGELRQVTREGKDITVESRWTLVRDSKGVPKSILIINTDITEKKMLEAQLLRAQRMESIGTLAGGIAHDLNNVLTPIMLSLQMLKEKFKDEQSQRLIAAMEQSSRRGANLIKQVLTFARGVEGERNPVRVAHIISEIEKIIKETFPRNIEIPTSMPKDLWTISGDATQLHQVIMNLCVNARDAMQEGGTLRISAENLLIDENYAKMHAEAKTGPYIVISVSDTGAGIRPEILERVFEPFFTTKEQGKGTGLGLSTALAIVKSHGGFMNVYSEVEKGTVFNVYLPAVMIGMQEAEAQESELPLGKGEYILVAEDEDSIREITVPVLETYGYKVLSAADGGEAVAVYAQNKDRIRVVLMDMMMPVMDGQDSILAIRRINSEVKIIAVSGLIENGKPDGIADRIQAFLQKPYTAEKLLKTINEVISAK